MIAYKKEETGEACSMQGRSEEYTQNISQNIWKKQTTEKT